MDVPRSAVRTCATALFFAVGLAAAPLVPTAAGAQERPVPSGSSRTQSGSVEVIDRLVEQAARAVEERYSRPLGHVAERRRDRVLVVPLRVPPPPGTLLEVVRAASGKQPERVVARLEVLQSEAGIVECRERDRVGRAHAERDDTVRYPVGSVRLLLAPCVSLVDVAPEIPQVIGERLRAALLRSTLLAVVDSPDAERRAEAAYLSAAAAEFVARQTNVHEVLYPVLLQTAGKMMLNVEYYSVERGRAIDIDVVDAPLDDLMRAWLRAGRPQQSAPPGYRRLPAQTRAWDIIALAAGPDGQLVAIDPDSVYALRFEYPGLRVRSAAGLGPPALRRRDAWTVVLSSRDLQGLEGAPTDLADGLLLLTDERKPLVLEWTTSAAGPPDVRPAGEIVPALEALWPGRRSEARWWPGTGHRPNVLQPCFVDLDGDGQVDRVWSETNGILAVRMTSQRGVRSFAGFGDIKAVQPAAAAHARPVLWLTDPVWHGEPDRLHMADLEGNELQILWSSEPFEGTLVALVSLDLNGDGIADLAAAEELPGGTRLHAYLALGGASGAPTPSPDGGARR